MHRRAFIRAIAAAATAVLGWPRRATARGRWWSSLIFGVFENHGFNQVATLPSHRRLASEGTVLTRYAAVTHPSGPNYRALISGETWSRAQTIDTFHPSVASQAAQLSPPVATYVYHLSGEIAHRHDPFRDLRAPVAAVRRGLPALQRDLGGALETPALVYVGWDDSNNMHDGDPTRADQNLMALLNVLSAAPWFTTPDPDGRYPALFFCYDEDNAREDNHVFAAWWGRGVRRGFASPTPHTHYSFCRTVTDNWGLAPLMRAAGAAPIAEPWT
jgi:phosphatidylinositol-3-phosphatase